MGCGKTRDVAIVSAAFASVIGKRFIALDDHSRTSHPSRSDLMARNWKLYHRTILKVGKERPQCEDPLSFLIHDYYLLF